LSRLWRPSSPRPARRRAFPRPRRPSPRGRRVAGPRRPSGDPPLGCRSAAEPRRPSGDLLPCGRRAPGPRRPSGDPLLCGRSAAEHRSVSGGPPLCGQRAAGSCPPGAPHRRSRRAAGTRLRHHPCAAPTTEPPPPAPTQSASLAAAPGPDGSRSAPALSLPDAALLHSQLLVPGFPHVPLDTTGGAPVRGCSVPTTVYNQLSAITSSLRAPSDDATALLAATGKPLRQLTSGPRTPPVLLSRSRRLSTPSSASTPRPTTVSPARACQMAPPRPLATTPTPSSPRSPRPQPFALLFTLRRRPSPASGQPSSTFLRRTPLSTPGGATRSCRPPAATPSPTTSSQRSLTRSRIGF
jgi:hypothetical protein